MAKVQRETDVAMNLFDPNWKPETPADKMQGWEKFGRRDAPGGKTEYKDELMTWLVSKGIRLLIKKVMFRSF